MHRKQFIKHCGFACAGATIGMLLLDGCASSKTVTGKIVDTDLVISTEKFLSKKSAQPTYRKYIIATHDQLRYPIYVYRFSGNEYFATLMQCTHQGAELQAFGDRLQCPAHNSEFNYKGEVLNGPANESLRSFPVVIQNNLLKISLKHV